MAPYTTTLRNAKTGEVILLKSNDRFILQNKVDNKKRIWREQNDRLRAREEKEDAINQAIKSSKLVEKEINEYKAILKSTLSVNDVIDWDKLQDKTPFREYEATKEPSWNKFAKTIPSKSFLEFIPYFRIKRENAESEANRLYKEAYQEWKNKEKLSEEAYNVEKSLYIEEQTRRNLEVSKMKSSYEDADVNGVEKYFQLVLELSKYPDSLNTFAKVEFRPLEKILLIDFELPASDQIPKAKSYKYVASKRSIETIDLSKKELEDLYNEIVYQISLRTIHEVVESDYADKVSLVVFNGWVSGVDSRTGKDFRNCLVSIQVTKKEFLEVNLEKISAQECFKYFKGVSAGSLINLAPIKPIMKLNYEDERIIEASSVIENLEESLNLATMEWQQFEILVRDLLSKEFSHDGCKVEVTRASRDAGVDAIVFDEDPIRGGKYVIQAKRYNNLVPVSAVRDLFGTVMNEGAVKGILITTSYFGSDALEFAKNKPLTLINGNELLYMFNKHGYKFQIELSKKPRANLNAANY